jgi:hypothetical protein
MQTFSNVLLIQNNDRQSVLESVNWNEDRAVDTLLLMSDPDYKPETQPQERQEGPGLVRFFTFRSRRPAYSFYLVPGRIR